MNAGTLSNFVSAACVGLGTLLPEGRLREVVLSASLLAFTGGITNSLALKMLFGAIPGLKGSKSITSRLDEIRQRIRKLLLDNFFSPSDLRRFISDRKSDFQWSRYVRKDDGPFAKLIGKQWRRIASRSVIDPIVDEQIEKLMDSSLGGLLLMMGMDNVKPQVSQFVANLLESLEKKVLDLAAEVSTEDLELELDEDAIVTDIRHNVDRLLQEKLQELDGPAVHGILHGILHGRLGWIVVWGNMIGAAMGVAAALV